MTLRGAAAIIGLAETASQPYSEGATTLGMLATIGMEAIQDAGLDPAQVDGLVTEGFNEAPFMAASTVAEYMGLRPAFAEVVDHGGATAGAMVIRAAAAIASGLCQTVVCVTAARKERQRPDRQRPAASAPSYKDRTPQGEFDVPFGASGAVFAYAMILNAYRAKYEATPAQLANIAVAERANAQRNAGALFHGQPLTSEEVMASPLVVEPIRRLDMTTTCAGAGAVVVTSAANARSARHPAVTILGAGENHTHRSISWAPPDLEQTGVRAAAERAFGMAGLGPGDMDLRCIYDCFTSTVLISLEDAGFTPKGTAGRFLQEHDISPDGDFPMNTHGGQLSFGQAGIAGGMSLITEAARQLMGRADGRQVKDCEFAFANGNGGVMSSQSALVLGRLS